MSTYDDSTAVRPFDEYIRPLGTYWYVIVVLACLMTAAANFYFESRPATYTATSSVLVSPVTQQPYQSLVTTERTDDMTTERRLANSRTVTNRAVELLSDEGQEFEADTFARNLIVSTATEARILDFSYTSTDPERASLAATAAASAYTDYRTEMLATAKARLQSDLDQRADELTEAYVALAAKAEAATEGSSERGSLAAARDIKKREVDVSLDAASNLAIMDVDAARLLDRAEVPENPDGIGLIPTLIGAAVGGLTIGVILAYLLAALRSQVRRRPSDDQNSTPPPPPATAQPTVNQPTVNQPAVTTTVVPPTPAPTPAPTSTAPSQTAQVQAAPAPTQTPPPPAPIPPAPVQPVPAPQAPTPASAASAQSVDDWFRATSDIPAPVAGSNTSNASVTSSPSNIAVTSRTVSGDLSGLIDKLGQLGAAGPIVVLGTEATTGHAGLSLGLGLAGKLVGIGAQVLMIDLAIDNPQAHRLPGITQQPGVAEVLNGTMLLAEAVQQSTSLPELHILALGKSPESVASGLAGQSLSRLLNRARLDYHAIILIGGAVDGNNARTLAHLADGAFVGVDRPIGSIIDPKLAESIAALGVPVLDVVRADSLDATTGPSGGSNKAAASNRSTRRSKPTVSQTGQTKTGSQPIPTATTASEIKNKSKKPPPPKAQSGKPNTTKRERLVSQARPPLPDRPLNPASTAIPAATMSQSPNATTMPRSRRL